MNKDFDLESFNEILAAYRNLEAVVRKHTQREKTIDFTFAKEVEYNFLGSKFMQLAHTYLGMAHIDEH